MGLTVVVVMQGGHTSANCSQDGSHLPSLAASLHLPGQVWTQGPQIAEYCSQAGSHCPVLIASWHLAGQVGA